MSNKPTYQLDADEQALLEAVEAGDFVSTLTAERKAQLEDAAATAFKKDKRINIRLASRDLEALQRRAMEEGMPYQTLIASILHKYVSGSLYEVSRG